MTTPDPATATAYAIIKAERATYGPTNPDTGLKAVYSAKIVGIRQSRPSKVERDEVLIRISVQLPAALFDPITPRALIVVPEDAVLARHVIEAEAVTDQEPTP